MGQPCYVSGLDLGQQQDYTALVSVEVEHAPDPDLPGQAVLRHGVRHVHRWPLGTPYPAIVGDLKQWFGRVPLNGTALVVDATGVGRAVVDMLRTSDLPAYLAPFTITCGFQEGDRTVPKKDLVAAVVSALQMRRLRFAEALELRPVLEKELEAFRVRVTPDRNETFASFRERDHDDLVLALALAVWYAERYGVPDPNYTHPAVEPLLPPQYGSIRDLWHGR
jgi:hypothetical protein